MLRIGGDGPLRGSLKKIAEDLGIRSQVEFLGTLRDPSALGEAMIKMKNEITSYDSVSIRAKCLARFSETVVVQQLSSVYNRVLQN